MRWGGTTEEHHSDEATITNFYHTSLGEQHELTYDDGRKFEYNMKHYSIFKLLPDKKKRKAETCNDTKTATFDYKVDGINGSYVGGFVIMPEELGRPGVGKFPHGHGVWTRPYSHSFHSVLIKQHVKNNELLKYDGTWKDGKKHGEGTETRWKLGVVDGIAVGQKISIKGEWCDGVLKK